MLSLLLLPTLILSCAESGPGAPLEGAAVFPVAARKTTFASVAELGPHVLEARTTVTTARDGEELSSHDERVVLRWQDADHWQWERYRDDRRLADVRVWDGRGFRGTGDGSLAEVGDPEPLRTDLALSTDAWRTLFGANESRVGFREVAEEDVEGRKVWRYALELLPAHSEGGKSRGLESVEGQVWIDQLTAVRLVGEVKVVARLRGELRTSELRFAISSIGGSGLVQAPPGVVSTPDSP